MATQSGRLRLTQCLWRFGKGEGMMNHANAPFLRRSAPEPRIQEQSDYAARVRYAVLFGAAVGVALCGIWYARVLFLLLFAGILTSVLLTTCTNGIRERFGLSRLTALALVCFAAMIIFIGAVLLLGSDVMDQFEQLQVQLPLAGHDILSHLRSNNMSSWLLSRFEEHTPQTGEALSLFRSIGGMLGSATNALAAAFVVVFVSLYLAIEPDLYINGIRNIIPPVYRPWMQVALAGASHSLRWWLLAKLCSMIAVGIFVGLGLLLLGIPLSGTLALFAGLLTFIPNLGPILSAVPAALLGFAISPVKGLSILALFAGVHFIEGNFVTPLLEKKFVKLPPALTLFLQLLLALVSGVLGVALAAPLIAAALGMVSSVRAARIEATTHSPVHPHGAEV